MKPIRSIAEIPFRERDPLELLNVAEHRDTPDFDYAGYGYGRVDAIHLEHLDDPDHWPRVRDALVLALHSADEPEELADDVELVFVMDEIAPGYAVTALLSVFLDIWLPMVSSDERAIVLSLCNPHRATIARPAVAGGTPVYYALGDVESWLDVDEGGHVLRLVADEWRTAD